MVRDLSTLPLENVEAFHAEKHFSAAAESYLRRALEALMDLGRHNPGQRLRISGNGIQGSGKGLERKRSTGTRVGTTHDPDGGLSQ